MVKHVIVFHGTKLLRHENKFSWNASLRCYLYFIFCFPEFDKKKTHKHKKWNKSHVGSQLPGIARLPIRVWPKKQEKKIFLIDSRCSRRNFLPLIAKLWITDGCQGHGGSLNFPSFPGCQLFFNYFVLDVITLTAGVMQKLCLTETENGMKLSPLFGIFDASWNDCLRILRVIKTKSIKLWHRIYIFGVQAGYKNENRLSKDL